MIEEELPQLLSTLALFCKTLRPYNGASVALSHLKSRPPLQLPDVLRRIGGNCSLESFNL